MTDTIHKERVSAYRQRSYFIQEQEPKPRTFKSTSTLYNMPLSVFDGQKDPNWVSQVANKQNATTPMTATESSYTHSDAYMSCSWFVKSTKRKYYEERGGDLSSSTGTMQAFDADTLQTSIDIASNNMLNASRSAQQRLGSLVVIGEAKESLDLIKTNSWRFLNLLSAYCRRLKKIRRMRRALDQAFNAWLELQFGVVPLLMDVDQASRTLQELYNVPRTQFVWGSGTANKVVSDSTVNKPFPNYFRFRERTLKEVICSTKFIGEVRAGLDSCPQGAFGLTDLLGVGWGDFIPSAWELLPWSFVVDYFSNVGDVLTHTFSSTPSYAWTCRTTREEGRSTYTLVADVQSTYEAIAAAPDFTNIYVTGVNGETSLTSKRVIRSSARPQIPAFRFFTPKIGVKWLNLTALAGQYRRLLPFN